MPMPYKYQLLYLADDTDDLLQFLTDIIPSEFTVVYAPVDHEKDAKTLPSPSLNESDIVPIVKGHNQIRKRVWCSV